MIAPYPQRAFAEELPAPQEGSGGTAELSESLLFGDIPSIYSASKYEQKVSEAPAAVSIVTADEIQKFGYRTLADILSGLQGVFTTNDRNYHYVAFRGFGRAGDYNSRVLLLIDGHRINDAIYDSAPIGGEFPLDVDLIDRVEVIRGPASSLYGTSAFFGVVNVITKRGRDFQGLQVSGGYGSQNTYEARSTYGRRFGNGLEVVLSSSADHTDGDDRLFYPEFNDPETNFGVAKDADDDDYYNLFAEISLVDFTLQAGYGYGKKVIPTASFETEFNTDDTWTVDSYSWLDLKYDHEFASGTQFLGRVFYDRYRYYGDYLYDYSETDEPDLVVNRDDAIGERWGSELGLTHDFFGRLRSTVGFEFEHGFQLDQENFDRRPRFYYLNDERDAFDWALYAQNELRLLDNLSLSAGLRYDHHDSFGGSLNPRTALIYTPFGATTFKLLYGTAFRAPSAYELYYESLDSWKPSPDLDPETIQTFEFVAEQEIGEHLRFVGSVYHSEIEDLIELTTDPSDDFLIFQNVSDIESYGAEVRLDARWQNGMEGRVSYALQRAEDKETGERITNSPAHLFKANLVVPILRDRLFAGTEFQYVSRRKTVSGGRTDDYLVTNLTLHSRQMLLEGLEVSATVYNLFDEEYSDPASLDHVQNAIEQDGRTFFLKATYQF
jgi:iron complex outermembrane receptor protein